MDKKEVRAVFSKTDRAIYISHLDLLRTMQRAIKRAKLPVWYSEGFNPRIYLNFPLALSLGTAGRNECMDLYITEEISFEDIMSGLNAVLPDGLHINTVRTPVNLNKDIGGAEYIVRMNGSSGIGTLFDEFVSADTIEVQKRSKKKGTVTMDIRPYLDIISSAGGDNIDTVCRLPAGNDLNINPTVLTDAFIAKCSEKGYTIDKLYIERTKILCINGEEFV